MATPEDFVGRSCPFCGAVNSLEVDDARGEVACLECAKVVAMGLEESLQTRYDKDATYDDVDRHAFHDENNQANLFTGTSSVDSAFAMGSNGGSKFINRDTAAARAAGLLGSVDGTSKTSSSSSSSRFAQYDKTKLHPRMRQYIEALCRLARRGEEVTIQALRLARVVIGYRRDRGVKVEHMNELAAACVLMATELCQQPLPLPELRTLDPTLRNVEMRRREVIADAQLEKEEAQLHQHYALHLIRYYIRLLRLQVIRYEVACVRLLRAINKVALMDREVDTLIETERVVAAVLLAWTCQDIIQSNNNNSSSDNESGGINNISNLTINAAQVPPSNSYSDFATLAHLSGERVHKIMQIVLRSLPQIKHEFDLETNREIKAHAKEQITLKKEECKLESNSVHIDENDNKKEVHNQATSLSAGTALLHAPHLKREREENTLSDEHNDVQRQSRKLENNVKMEGSNKLKRC